jgi:basic membrane protein A and related proteins
MRGFVPRLAALALASVLTLAGCASADGGDGGEGGGGEGGGDRQFIFISSDPIGINKFLESGKTGTEQAAKQYGGTAKTYESSDEASRRANLEAAVAEAPDVIVLISFTFTELAQEFAEQNPEQQFVLVDACPEQPPENLYCGVFREHEAAYLLGVEAGMLTRSDKIGSVVAQDIPFLHRFSDSFRDGAKSVNPQVTDSQVFIGGNNPFADPARAKEQALALAASGADHIAAFGSGSNGGVFEAAAEQGFFSYGVDVNQCPMSKGHVVDNAIKAVDTVVVDLVGQVLDGQAENQNSYGLAEGGMDVSSLTDDNADCVVMQHDDVLEKVEETKQGIIDGTIKVTDPLTAG